MAVSKVILNGNTLIDTTDKTVTSGGMLSGVTALKNDGTSITGNIATKTSSDLTASGATVTAPAGYYASSASKSVSSGSATTPATSITANPSISVSSGGLITASVSASQSVTPTVSAGYVSSGMAGTVSVSGSNTSQLTAQAAQTLHPSTSDQTIASGKYLTGAQTVKGVLLTNLSAGNFKKDVVVKIGDYTDDDCVASVTGTFEGGGGGLVYETGTWTPSEDVASYWFSFTNTHTEPPFYYMVADSNGDYTDLASTNTFVAYNYFTQVTGNAIYPSTDSTNYGYVVFRYKTSGSLASLGHPISDTSDANSGYPRYWATETGVRAYTSSSSRYWRSGRTYKWIAVWPPTT